MTDKLVDFVNALDQDPTLQEEYSASPRDSLTAFGVDIQDIDLLMSGDIAKIKSRLNMSGIAAFLIIIALK